MAFENAFGGINYGMIPRARQAEANRFQQALGQGMAAYNAKQDRELKERQMQLRAEQGGEAPQRKVVNGKIVEISPDGSTRVLGDYGVSPNTVVNVGGEQDSFNKALGKGAATQVLEMRNKAKDAADSLNNSREAIELLNEGVTTGFGAEAMTTVYKALNAAGIPIKEDQTANTEAYIGLRVQEVGRIITMFGSGTGLSDADREYAAKAAAGNITMNEQSLRKLIDIQNI